MAGDIELKAVIKPEVDEEAFNRSMEMLQILQAGADAFVENWKAQCIRYRETLTALNTAFAKALEEPEPDPDPPLKPGDEVIWDDGDGYLIGRYCDRQMFFNDNIVSVHVDGVMHSVPRDLLHKVTGSSRKESKPDPETCKIWLDGAEFTATDINIDWFFDARTWKRGHTIKSATEHLENAIDEAFQDGNAVVIVAKGLEKAEVIL